MPALHGEQHYAHRITEQDVRDIRASYVPGLISYAELAEQYGITKQTVHKIITKQIWKHIDAD